MRKRLQKKKGIGRYGEVCFTVALTAKPEGAYDWDRFFAEFLGMLEERALRCRPIEGDAALVIEAGRRGGDAGRRRRAVLDWLDERPELAAVRAGGLVDAPRLAASRHP